MLRKGHGYKEDIGDDRRYCSRTMKQHYPPSEATLLILDLPKQARLF